MRDHNYKYGYKIIKGDEYFVTIGLNEFVENYIQRFRLLNHTLFNDWNKYHPNRRHQPLIYYNNFEVVHVQSFLTEEVLDFAKNVDQSYQIYQSRWGDAPLRYATVNLFLNTSKDVWNFCDLVYKH